MERKMSKYSFQIQACIMEAMSKHNKIMPGPRFNTIDGNILSIVKSFHDSNTTFFMSNKQLANITISDPSTVQRSIDRLVCAGLLKRETSYTTGKQQRILIYQKDQVQKLLELV